MTLGRDDLLAARRRVAPLIHRTPVLTCEGLDRRAAARLLFKCENFQKTGSFKMRGASNALGVLRESDPPTAVATHSSGNFAAALALAARSHGMGAFIVMPGTASAAKRDAVREYGGEIIECDPTLEARETTAAEVSAREGAPLVHPHNDLPVIAGQSTATMELLDEEPNLDVVVAPVGGGGLISGTALAAHYFGRDVKVYGAEPAGADDAFRSLQAGRIVPSVDPDTIADGLRTSLGPNTFPVIQQHVEAIILVEDSDTIAAMHAVWMRMKIIIEPSSAVAVAAVLNRPDLFEGRRVGIILSGGNVDLGRLPF